MEYQGEFIDSPLSKEFTEKADQQREQIRIAEDARRGENEASKPN